MSKFMYLDLGVYITLFSSSLTVRRSTVGVPQYPGQFNRLPHTVSLVLLGSLFSGLYLINTLSYMTSLQQSVRRYSLLMNMMVFVPSTWPDINCASCASLFPYDVPHTSRYLSFFMRCLFSISSPVSSYKTALSICIGDFILGIFSVVTFSFFMSTHARIAS